MPSTEKVFCCKCVKVTDCRCFRVEGMWEWVYAECGSVADQDFIDEEPEDIEDMGWGPCQPREDSDDA